MLRLSKPDMVVQSENFGMGTVISNKVFGEQAEEALHEALKETARLEGILSRFIPGGDIGRVNGSAGVGCEKVGSETYEVVSRAVEFSGYCHGCFDVTVGPLVSLWSVAREKLAPPDKTQIRNTLALVNYTNVILDLSKEEIGLKKAGQSIDLGGIGKGFAADKIIEVFNKYEVSSAFTNFGGNVAVLGAKPDGSPWRVGIRHPRRENSLIGLISVTDRSVVTSGDYQRYFTGIDGKRYHHILDPFTGYPAESGLVSATIVADSSMTADALSTMLFVAGMNRGFELLESFPGTEAVLIDEKLTVYITQGLKDSFQAANGIKIKILEGEQNERQD